jgi:hypothetical protein
MTGKQQMRNFSYGILISAYLCFGQTDSSDNISTISEQPGSSTTAAPAPGTELKSTQSLWFAVDEGQAMQGTDPVGAYKIIDRLWQQRMYFHFTNDMTYIERLRLILSIECQLTFSMKQIQTLPQTLAPLFFFYPNDVELSYAFGNLEKPWLQLSAGYFPYKYNPDAKDLGEYLLRDGAYPTYIITNYEFAQTRELGFHLNGFVGNPAVDQFKWDILLTSETHFWPLQDWTLSGVVSNNLFNFLDVGAGASGQRLISVGEDITTPKNISSRYFNEAGDTSYFTYRALKLMGRASINPMRFIPEIKIPVGPVFGDKPLFGKEDWKIYGEIGVLGLTNYTAYKYDSVLVDTAGGQPGHKVWTNGGPLPKANNYYDSLGDRMPYMIGINLPTTPLLSYGILPFLLTKWLKDESGSDIRPLAWITLIPALASGVCNHYFGWDMSLDVLSLEFEWMSQRFPNDNGYAINPTNHRPIPVPEAYRNNLVGTPQQVKYALYFKKSFVNQKFALSGLVARDHMRPAVHADPTNTINDDFLQTKSMWWWTLRLSANF